MSNQEILTKAIEKAIANGWDYLGKPENGWGVDVGQWNVGDTHLLIVRQTSKGDYAGDDYIHFNQIIFDHDFAKSLWPEESSYSHFTGGLSHGWQYHLQQMVIAENPIKYLGENMR